MIKNNYNSFTKVIIGGILFLSVIYSCRSDSNGKHKLVIKRYSDGNKESEINYVNDTMQGMAKYYYNNGKVQDEINYNKGIEEGLSRHFDTSGIIVSEVHYKNGVEEGKGIWYYPNHAIKESSYWRDGKRFGDAFFYYPDGKLMRYNCIDFYGKPMYVLKYDENGNKIIDEGVVFSPHFFANTKREDTVDINQEILISTTVARPPNTSAKIWMGEMSEDSKIVELSIQDGIVSYSKRFTRLGTTTLITIGEIRNERGIVIDRDSTATHIIVVGK